MPVKHDSDSDDERPLARTQAKTTKRPKAESDSDDAPLAKTKKVKVKKESTANGVKKENSTPVKKKKAKEEVKEEDLDAQPEDEDEEYRWWEAEQSDGTKKWTTLEHNGVLFPPPYEPLPKHVKMKYNGKEVDLPPEAEEVAGFFAALIESDHGKNPVFQQNFFSDWLHVLKECNAVTFSATKSNSRLHKLRSSRSATSDPCGSTLKPRKRRKRNLQRKKKQRQKKQRMRLRQNINIVYLTAAKKWWEISGLNRLDCFVAVESIPRQGN